MGVQLNIKSAEARSLAEQLAAESGDSITKAVTEALRERLDNVRRERARLPSSVRERERAVHALLDGSRARWRVTPEDIEDSLYDERGLPR